MRPGGFAPAGLGRGPGRPPLLPCRVHPGQGGTAASGERYGRSALHQVREEEVEVGGAFGEAAHEVGVPLGAVGEVDAEAVAFGDDLLLEVAADAVEHLELEAATVAAVAGDQGPGETDHGR